MTPTAATLVIALRRRRGRCTSPWPIDDVSDASITSGVDSFAIVEVRRGMA